MLAHEILPCGRRASMKIIVSIAIACPVESVFAFVSDYTRDRAWRAGIIEMSQTPAGRSQLGTHTLEVARFFGRTMTTLAEVTKYEPGRAIDFAGVMAKTIRVSGSRRVEEANGQAHFTYQATVEGHGFLGLPSPLPSPEKRSSPRRQTRATPCFLRLLHILPVAWIRSLI